jgi:hypothetical protein
VWVRIIKKEVLRVEFHLPLLALHLIGNRDKKNKKKKETEKLSARAYIRVIAGTLARVEDCEVNVKEVTLPCKTDSFSTFTLVKPFGYQGLIYAIIAYLQTKAKRLTLDDNAIISSPDVKKIHYYVTVKLRLYQLIYALLTFRRGINKEKRARRINYVGE